MSAGEIIGLALTVALIGGAVGAAIGAVLARGRNARAKRMHRVAEAYSRWLAARWTMSRASMSFVAAFRALAAERRESVNFSLREQEAQRARADWCDALRELDRAEAEITVLEWESGAPRRAEFSRLDADELRAVIQGDSSAVDTLRERLRPEDEKATEFARQQVAAHHRCSPLLRPASQAVRAFGRRIVSQWDRG